MDAPYAWAFLIVLAAGSGIAYYTGHRTAAIVVGILTLGQLIWMMYTTISEKGKK